MEPVVIPMSEPLKRDAVVLLLSTSFHNLTGAINAAVRRVGRDGMGHITEEDVRRAALHLRAYSAMELAKSDVVTGTNALKIDVIVRGGGQL